MKDSGILLILGSLFLILSIGAKAQVSTGGFPPSDKYRINLQAPVIELDKPDLLSAAKEDDNGQIRFHRVGVSVPVYMNLSNSGRWQTLDSGMKIWTLTLKVPDALALGVYYDDFYLPPGAELFVYNESRTQILGAYTELNNSNTRLFSNELVQGESVTFEYIEPAETEVAGAISIQSLAYVYRDVSFNLMTNRVNESQSCMININCPEGDNWQDEKRGVARIFLKVGANYGWCSGSLVNNMEEDCFPYFLTAFHCGDGASDSDFNQWVFYFNYESVDCNNPTSAPASGTISGCTKVSEGNISAGSDFLFVHFNTYVPADYNAYYNGWNRQNTASSSGVCVHHPAGDIKKISTYSTSTFSYSPNIGGSQMALNSTWGVSWAATVSGQSLTEGGSSGSPLFNASGLVIGTLSGGSSSCDQLPNPGNEFYGKLSYHWTSNGTTADKQLAPWLDPNGVSGVTLAGKENCGDVPPVADFIASDTIVMVGGSVTFTDVSGGFPTSRYWNFEGASPAVSAQAVKTVSYPTVGTWNVQLISTSPTGKDTLLRVDYITVVDNTILLSKFSADQTDISEGTTVHFSDESLGNPTSWSWSFQGGSPSTSTAQNPDVTYFNQGVYNVTLTVSNGTDTDVLTKNGYIIVTPQAFTLDFESSADYSSSFDPWTAVDGDQVTTYGSSDCDFPGEQAAMSFMAFNPTDAAFSLENAHGGVRCGMSICPSDASASDDWLISPLLNLGTNSSISLYATSPKTGDWGNDEYEIAVSTTNNSPASFVSVSGTIEAPVDWTMHSYDLSAFDNQQVYIAIHHVSADRFMLLIDDIVINTNLVGLNNMDLNDEVHIYPNPAKGYFYIKSANQTAHFESIQLVNAIGEVVPVALDFEADRARINVAEVPAGVYFVTLSYDNIIVSKRITILE